MLGDNLYGGTGADNYKFTGSFGSDWVIDSDGQGKIEVDGMEVNGTDAEKASPTTNSWSTDQWAFTLVPNGAGGNDLDPSARQQPEPDPHQELGQWPAWYQPGHGTRRARSGQHLQRRLRQGHQRRRYGLPHIERQLRQCRYAQIDAQDLINGSTLADSIAGGGGNDGLAGGDGDDMLEGGAGSDVLLGGWGADTLRGGDGNDFIFGSSSGTFTLPTAVDFTPIASQGTELARGFNWVVYDPPGLDGSGIDAYTVAGGGNICPTGSRWATSSTATRAMTALPRAPVPMSCRPAPTTMWSGAWGRMCSPGGRAPTLCRRRLASAAALLCDLHAPSYHGDDLDGGAGNDRLSGQGGDDELYGGADNDLMWGDEHRSGQHAGLGARQRLSRRRRRQRGACKAAAATTSCSALGNDMPAVG